MAIGIESIDKKINEELDLVEGNLETYLKNPEPPTWVLPDNIAPSNRDFLEKLRLPSYRNGHPSLLFHDLDVCDEDEIDKIFHRLPMYAIIMCPSNHWLQVHLQYIRIRQNAAHVGNHWGFYLVAAPDSNGVGVEDMHQAFEAITQYHGWTSDLRGVPPEQRTTRIDTNKSIASGVIQKVLAARTVVFERFLQLVIKMEGKLEEKHKRIWLLFQLSDELYPGDITHPFVQIMKKCLNKASPEALEALIGRIGTM